MLYSLFPKFERRTIRNYLTVLGLLFFLVLLVNSQAFPQSFSEVNRNIVGAVEEYGRIALHSEANQGQVDEQVQFLARGQGYNLYLANG